MENIKVSVIIPAYNVEKYLEKCLDTVINQTLKEIEVIVIDNASTDSTSSIIQKYSEKDGRIKVVTTSQNVTAGEARNHGLEIAKGEYLSFLDSDDYFELDMLEKMYMTSKTNSTDICIVNYVAFDSGTEEQIFSIRPPYFFRKKYNNRKIEPIDCNENLFCLFTTFVWDKMFKTSFIRDLNIKFQEIKAANDIFFSYIALAFAKSIIYIDERFVHYRQRHVGTLSSNRKWKHTYIALESVKQYLEKKNKFKIFRKTFFDFFYLNFTLVLMNGNSEEILFIRNLLHEKLEYFNNSADKSFNFYALNNFDLKEIKNMTYMEEFYSFYYDMIVNNMYKYKNKKIALWGVGKNGRAFFNIFGQELNIKYVIDNDSEKQGNFINGIEVKSFYNIKDKIDIIIVTNRNFYEDILLEAKKNNTEIEVIDIDSYLNFNVEFEKCIE